MGWGLAYAATWLERLSNYLALPTKNGLNNHISLKLWLQAVVYRVGQAKWVIRRQNALLIQIFHTPPKQRRAHHVSPRPGRTPNSREALGPLQSLAFGASKDGISISRISPAASLR
jgi:hypothetical protein